MLFTILSLLQEAESVAFNPPGWIGGGLALLSVLLPLIVYFWLKRRGPVARGHDRP